MCKCVNIEMGSYDNQDPYWFKGQLIGLDRCIADEVNSLWKNGIVTTGSCCGHNKVNPMINVNWKSEGKMNELGYEFWINQFGVKCYNPKNL